MQEEQYFTTEDDEEESNGHEMYHSPFIAHYQNSQ